ncbi:MAG: tyrosine-protein phosphatase, partial [Clostridiales bacterium]|nr:tyrosine-protein phosphatase [Clostridiales bacterium]
MLNFRDLGGIVTEDGRKIKKGLFFRCAMLEEASENDIAELKKLGIKLIFDYRNPEEIPEAGGYPYNEIGA